MNLLKLTTVFVFVAGLTACGTAAQSVASSAKPQILYTAIVTVNGRQVRLPDLGAKDGVPATLSKAATGPSDAGYELTVTPEILPNGQIRSAVQFRWVENEVADQIKFAVTTSANELTGVTEMGSAREFQFQLRAARP